MNNHIQIVGYVGQDPQHITVPKTGNEMATFTVAVKEHRGANADPSSHWFDVVTWNGGCKRVLDNITKGREVVVTGRLSFDTYTSTKEGKEKEVMKPIIRLGSFHLCGSAPRKREEVLNDNQLTKIS
jgi:single stranded DNA-binding protein